MILNPYTPPLLQIAYSVNIITPVDSQLLLFEPKWSLNHTLPYGAEVFAAIETSESLYNPLEIEKTLQWVRIVRGMGCIFFFHFRFRFLHLMQFLAHCPLPSTQVGVWCCKQRQGLYWSE